MRYLQKCQGGGPGLPYMGSVGATPPTYSMANFFKMTFARGSYEKLNSSYREAACKSKLLLIKFCCPEACG